MKIAEIKEIGTKELLERVDAEKIALNQMQVSHAVTPLDNPAKIKRLRRTIARMITELRQREITQK